MRGPPSSHFRNVSSLLETKLLMLTQEKPMLWCLLKNWQLVFMAKSTEITSPPKCSCLWDKPQQGFNAAQLLSKKTHASCCNCKGEFGLAGYNYQSWSLAVWLDLTHFHSRKLLWRISGECESYSWVPTWRWQLPQWLWHPSWEEEDAGNAAQEALQSSCTFAFGKRLGEETSNLIENGEIRQ